MMEYRYLTSLHMLKDFHEEKDQFEVTENTKKIIKERLQWKLNHEFNRINSIDIRS
jgi:hypothetical protein